MEPLKLFIKKILLNSHFKANFKLENIEAFKTIGGFPSLQLKSGLLLSSFNKRGLPKMEHLGIPAGYQEVVLEYINRYCFPHFMPVVKMNSGFIPLAKIPMVVHPNHKNSIFELESGLWDELKETMSIVEGDQVMELGSFIGFGSVRMSGLVGNAGKVVSVEADELAFELLEHNVSQNNIGNVSCRNHAIGEDDQEAITFWKTRRQANSLEKLKGAVPYEVAVHSIPTVAAKTDTKPSFIVLTINGSELRTLEAAKEYLAELQPIRIVAAGWYTDEQGQYAPRITALLRSIDFTVHSTKGGHVFAYKV